MGNIKAKEKKKKNGKSQSLHYKFLKYVLRLYWLCMTYENKKVNIEWKKKNQIGEKQGFCQPVAKFEDENQANISTRTFAKSSSVLKKRRKEEKGVSFLLS